MRTHSLHGILFLHKQWFLTKTRKQRIETASNQAVCNMTVSLQLCTCSLLTVVKRHIAREFTGSFILTKHSSDETYYQYLSVRNWAKQVVNIVTFGYKLMSDEESSSVRHFLSAGWRHTLLIPPSYAGMRWLPFILVILKSQEKNSYIMRTSSPRRPPFYTHKTTQTRGEKGRLWKWGQKSICLSNTFT